MENIGLVKIEINENEVLSRKKRSPVWEYFEICRDDHKFAVCLLCSIRLSRGGEGKKAGTSSMIKHINSKHSIEFNALGKSTSGVLTKPLSPPPVTRSLSGSDKKKTIQELLENKLPDANDKTKKYHYLIAEMIALDNQPLSVVERTGFSRLLEEVLPCYKIPTPKYISEKIVPDIYQRIFEKIKRNISKSPAISVTSELWSCLHNNDRFLSFRARWLTPEFKIERAVLATMRLKGFHTGENVAKELDTIADLWNINRKIHLLVHNSVKNIGCVHKGEYDSARCFIHLLQRAINESIKTQPEVSTMLDTCRRLVTHFSHSGLAQEKLKAIQKDLNLSRHKLVQDISTRWNSTFYMIQRLLEQKRAISLYAADHDTLANLTSLQWTLKEQCVRLWQPFAEITKITSSGQSCISEVIPHVAALKKYLDKSETEQRTPDLRLVRASLKSELESSFNSLSQNYNYLISTFLDPRFKTDFLGVVEAERARQKILLEFIKMSHESSVSDCSTPAKKSRREETGPAEAGDVHDTFWACYNEVANESNESQSNDRERNAIACEIAYYIKKLRIDRNHDPYVWWSENELQYPNLTKFARIYLSAPSSSVHSDTLFSEPGLVYEEERNRLLPLNPEKLLFIHHNLPLVQFEY